MSYSYENSLYSISFPNISDFKTIIDTHVKNTFIHCGNTYFRNHYSPDIFDTKNWTDVAFMCKKTRLSDRKTHFYAIFYFYKLYVKINIAEGEIPRVTSLDGITGVMNEISNIWKSNE